MRRLLRFMDWPLRVKMAALFMLASFLPSGIVTLVNIPSARQELRSETAALLATRADQLVQKVDSFHRVYVRSVSRVAGLPNVIALCQNRPEDVAKPESDVRTFLDVWPASDPNIRGVAILDPAGKVIAATENVLLGKDFSSQSYVAAAQGGGAVISDIHLAEPQVGSTPTIAYLCPVLSSDQHRVGFTVFWIRAAALWDLMKQSNGLAGANSFAVMFDQSGIRIAHTFSDEIVFHPAGRLDPSTVDTLAAARRFGDQTRPMLEDIRPFPEQFNRARSPGLDLAMFSGLAPANQQLNYGVARRSEIVPWTIFYMVPDSALRAQISTVTRQQSFFAAGSILIALFSGIWFATLLLKPVVSLSRATGRIASGDLTARAQSGNADELGLLGASFNAMAGRIEDQAASLIAGRDELESRILDRTSALSKAGDLVRMSEARMGGIVNSAMDAIISVDAHQRIVLFNAAAEAMFRCSAADAMNGSFERFIPQRFRSQHQAHVQEFGQTGVTSRSTRSLGALSGLRRDGEEFPIEASISQVEVAGDKVYTVILRDITDRNRAETALRTSEAQLQTIVENINEAVVVSSLAGELLHFNHVALQLLGYSSLIEGRRQMSELADTFEVSGIDGTPWTVEQWPLARILRGEKVCDLEARMRRIGTDWEKTFSFGGSIANDAAGQPLMAIVTFSDITERKRADDALRTSEEQFRRLVEDLQDYAIFMLDRAGCVASWNAGAQRLKGYTEKEIIGRSYEVFFTPQDIAAGLPVAELKLAAEQERWKVEGWRIRADGSRFWAEVMITALKDDSGELRGFSKLVRDISVRKQAEDALLKAGALQRAIFESANFSCIATDVRGVIQLFNVGAERMLGYTAAETVNVMTTADLHDSQELIARAAALSREFGTPIAPGVEALVFKASRGIEDIYELTKIRKDSSRFPALVSVTALRDAQDTIIGYLLIGTDNTARKQAEEALLKAGALQRAIFNSANFSSIATDAKGVIQIFNVGAERMLGYTAAEVMNKVTPADISDPQEVIARAAALTAELGTPITPGFEALVYKASRGIEDIYELSYIRKDGSEFPAVVSVTALRDAQDAIIGYLLIGTDNTARKQAEDAKQASEARYHTLFEHAPDGIVIADANSYYLDANSSICQMLGYARNELIGLHASDIVSEREVPHIGTAISMIKENPRYEREWEFKRKDGSHFVAEVIATLMPDGNLMGMIRDITERKHTEARFRRLMDSNAQGVIFWNTSGQISKANDAFLRIVGYSRDDLDAGRLDWMKLTPPEYAEIDRHSLEEIATRGFCTPLEKEYIRRDGSRVPVIIGAAIFEDNKDEGVCFVLDRTDSQRAELAAVLLSAIVESTLDAVIGLDLNGIVTSWNIAAVRIFGYSADEIVGHSVALIIPPSHAHDEQQILSRIQCGQRIEHFETERLRKDGRLIAVSVTVSPIKDSRGRVVGASKLARDITERKLAETAIRESEEYFRFLNDLAAATRNLADPAQIMAVMARMLGEHLHVSRCAYADVENDGERFVILHDYTDGCASTIGTYQLSLFGDRAADTLHNGQTLVIRSVEAELSSFGGAEMFNAIGIKAIITCPLLKDGSLRAMMAVHQSEPRDWKPQEIAMVQEVAERCWATIQRRTAEETIHQLNAGLEQRVVERTAQLKTANNELEAFAYSVSHDLRAPLRSLDGFSQALMEDCADKLDAEDLDHLNRIRAASQRMGHLIDDLLDLSRLTRVEMHAQRVDLSRVVREIADELIAADPQRKASFVIPGGIGADGDPALLRIALTNLLSNAWKFTARRADATIEFGCDDAEGSNAFFIRDNGAGFDMAYAGKLFGAFQRMHPTKEFAGTGIGLATVQRIVHRHGGRVWAEAAVDQGATIHFTL